MEGPTREELRTLYKEWTTDELIRLREGGTLTSVAEEVIEQELKVRGVLPAHTSDAESRPPDVRDEQLAVTLATLSARGLLKDTGTYSDALERQSEEPFFQIIYQAQDDQGDLIILSKTFVIVNEGMGFSLGFRYGERLRFLRAVRREWVVSAKKPKAINDNMVKGKIYSLYKKEIPWGFLFSGHAGTYIFEVAMANLDRLDLGSFEQIIREHVQTVSELPPTVEPADIALDTYTITFPTVAIRVLSPGPLEKQPSALSPQEKSFLRNSESYGYAGRRPLFEVNVNWSQLQEGQGPADLNSGVRGGMSALGQADRVTGLKYQVMETTGSGPHGLRVTGTFYGSHMEMRLEGLFCAEDGEAWNVLVFLPSRDKKAHQTAIRIVESVEVRSTWGHP